MVGSPPPGSARPILPASEQEVARIDLRAIDVDERDAVAVRVRHPDVVADLPHAEVAEPVDAVVAAEVEPVAAAEVGDAVGAEADGEGEGVAAAAAEQHVVAAAPRHEVAPGASVIAVDGVQLKDFDYVDIGALVPVTNVVPLIIKSLLFK